jgi:hypothetical protein
MKPNMIHRLSVAALIAVIAYCCHVSTAYAIRYELIDGAGGEQGGHTLSGFIEFDSICGTLCTAANITDFAFSVSGPSNYSYSYQSAADVDLSQAFVNAGPMSLTVDYHRPGRLALMNVPGSGPLLEWASALNPNYLSTGPNLSGGWQSGPYPPFVAVIGTVIPEPSAAILMLMATMAFLLARSRARF